MSALGSGFQDLQQELERYKQRYEKLKQLNSFGEIPPILLTSKEFDQWVDKLPSTKSIWTQTT